MIGKFGSVVLVVGIVLAMFLLDTTDRHQRTPCNASSQERLLNKIPAQKTNTKRTTTTTSTSSGGGAGQTTTTATTTKTTTATATITTNTIATGGRAGPTTITTAAAAFSPTRSCHLQLDASSSIAVSANIDSNKIISATWNSGGSLTLWDPVACSIIKSVTIPYGYASLNVFPNNTILAGAGDTQKLDKYAYPSLSLVE